MEFDPKAMKRLYIDSQEARAYFFNRQPDLTEALDHYLKFKGEFCPFFVASLKILWSEETQSNGNEFRQHLRRWGYSSS